MTDTSSHLAVQVDVDAVVGERVRVARRSGFPPGGRHRHRLPGDHVGEGVLHRLIREADEGVRAELVQRLELFSCARHRRDGPAVQLLTAGDDGGRAGAGAGRRHPEGDRVVVQDEVVRQAPVDGLQ